MKDCCICQITNSKYKCPTCKQYYCSTICCKSHKSLGCEPPIVETVNEQFSKPKYDFPTEDTVPVEKLELLRYSDDVKECLKNPHVRNMIEAILRDPDITSAIAAAMVEPIFVELADACLKVVETSDNDKPC